jgi:hypothetical protein
LCRCTVLPEEFPIELKELINSKSWQNTTDRIKEIYKDKSEKSLFGSSQSIQANQQRSKTKSDLSDNNSSSPQIVSFLQQNAEKLHKKISNAMLSQSITLKPNGSPKIKKNTQRVMCGVVVTAERELRRR